MSSYKGLYEASVVTVGADGEPIFPYFNQQILRSYANEFIGEKVAHFTGNFTLKVNFFQKDGVTECTENDLARSVKINLKADVNFLYKYNCEKCFSISERSNV